MAASIEAPVEPVDPMMALLALLHPDGVAPRRRVIGRAYPRGETASTDDTVHPASADLVVFAPSKVECGTSTWLAAAAQTSARAVADEGLLYVAAPGAFRGEVVRLLEAEGLVLEQRYLWHPGWPDGSIMIPLTHRALSYAYSQLIATLSWRRDPLLAMLRLPVSRAALARYWHSAGCVMRRPGARPSGSWLHRMSGRDNGAEIILAASWRGSDGAVVLSAFAGSASPPAFVGKTAPGGRPADNLRREAENLRSFGRRASVAGISVPDLIKYDDRSGPTSLVQSFVEGKPVRSLLESEPGILPEIAARIADWLGTWHLETCTAQPLTLDRLTAALIAPAAQLAQFLPDGTEYLAWLSRTCNRMAGTIMPSVAVHNDLTMMNILRDKDGSLAVIDWEQASGEGMPLTDFFYAMVDAVMYTAHHNDRRSAFASCFAPSGEHAPLVARLQRKLTCALSLSDELVSLCFHATWLFHAKREADSVAPESARPFLALLISAAQQVASDRVATA